MRSSIFGFCLLATLYGTGKALHCLVNQPITSDLADPIVSVSTLGNGTTRDSSQSRVERRTSRTIQNDSERRIVNELVDPQGTYIPQTHTHM